MSERVDVALLIFFLPYWFFGWHLQTENFFPKDEIVQARWYMRIFFGLRPIDGALQIRPAFMQGLAMLMIVGGTIVRRMLKAGNPALFVLILFVFYLILLGVVSHNLNRKL